MTLSDPTPALTVNDILADPRWPRLLARDTHGAPFVYAVTTTGIFCRAGCPSPAPRPENVRFFDRPDQARAAGFRACLRCRPEASEAVPDWLEETCRRIEQAEAEPGLEVLARAAGMSAAHLQKRFKAALGLSPHQYAAALRRERVQQELARRGSVTGAIYEAGFQSGSRFYETSPALLGMKPAVYAGGGAGEEIVWGVGPSSLGLVLAARTRTGVCAIFMGDDEDDLVRALTARFPKAALKAGDDAFAATLRQVISVVEQPSASFALPLDIRGTAFQHRVWDALRAIPAGQTRTYAQVADSIGAPEAVRAVAGACAANRLAIVIPCHRVVRTDGSLSGYRWGVERKRALLKREQD